MSENASAGLYETERLVSEYLLFHYAAPQDYLPWPQGPATALNFPVRTVRELLGDPPADRVASALDLGCSVGRSTFELTRDARQVTGADLSRAFVRAAETMRNTGGQTVRATVEGSLTRDVTVSAPACAPDSEIHFQTADALRPPEQWTAAPFDIVHAANLLCRLPRPAAFLELLPSLVKPGGRLALTTPCTWLEDFTPPEEWPDCDTFSWLKSRLETEFELVRTVDLPFLIREHERKYQWSVALGSLWRRRG